ncbi:hypothetical protein MRX96_015938 [Rhipicephalus microplus]
MVTGLPRQTRLHALKSCSRLNDLNELVDMRNHTQEMRLRAANAGRYILMLLGCDINTLAMLHSKTPPWEITDAAAPPVGDRLRDNHKIKVLQAAPT